MLEKYKTIYAGGEGEITEKKSRFIATVRLVEKEEDALAFIEEMKKKYWDARHNCYAYSIGEHREFTRCSDDWGAVRNCRTAYAGCDPGGRYL